MDGILAELQRQVSKCLTVGIVTEVSGQMVRVEIGKNFTPMIPFLALRAGEIKIYCPPSVGEQVFVFSAGGSYENAVAGPSIFCDKFPEPVEGKELFIDAYGTTIKVDADGVTINAGKSTITGDVEIIGNVNVSGEINASGMIVSDSDVAGGGVSLSGHVHGGVLPGSGITGAAL